MGGMSGVKTAPRLTLNGLLDQLPFNRVSLYIVLAAGIANGFDAFDTFTIAYAMPALVRAWNISPVVNGMLASAGMWGALAGALLCGPVSDKFGRKVAFGGTIFGFGLITGLTAFANTIPQFVVYRFLTGLCLGGMPPCASTYVAEQIGARYRGRAITSMNIWWPAGTLGAAFAAYALVPKYGWRPLFLIGVLPVFFALVAFPTFLPESPRWLAIRGKQEKLEKVLRRAGATEEQIQCVRPEEQTAKVPFSVLLHPPYRTRFIATAGAYLFGMYAYFGWVLWLPSILATIFKLSIARTFTYTLMVAICALLGKASSVYVVEKFGRKPVFYSGYGLAAVCVLLLGLTRTPSTVLIFVCLTGYGLDLGSAAHYVWTPELYPSKLRGTANSWSSAAGKIGASIGPLSFGFYIAAHLSYMVFVSVAVACVLVCLIVGLVGIETKGKNLEDLGAA